MHQNLPEKKFPLSESMQIQQQGMIYLIYFDLLMIIDLFPSFIIQYNLFSLQYLNDNIILLFHYIMSNQLWADRKLTPLTPRSGIFIGPYRYDKNDVLGSGYQSKVYKAYNVIKKHQVALKVVDMKSMNHGINQKLFHSEIKSLKEMRNTPYILNLHEVITTEEKVYIITELCHGDLQKRTDLKLTEEHAWTFLLQLIKAYKYLYDKNIVHRDLKPGNLFLNAKKEIKIGDFGFAATTEEVKKQNNYNVGSPIYMAPEALSKNDYSHASDIWSIGIIYYELLTGHTPWSAVCEAQIQAQMNEEYISKFINQLNLTETSQQFLKRTLCVDKYQRIKPEQLFAYAIVKLKKNDSASISTKVSDQQQKVVNQHLSFGSSQQNKNQAEELKFLDIPHNLKVETKKQVGNLTKWRKLAPQVQTTKNTLNRSNSFSTITLISANYTSSKTTNNNIQISMPTTPDNPTFRANIKSRGQIRNQVEQFFKIKDLSQTSIQTYVIFNRKLIYSLYTFVLILRKINHKPKWGSELHLFKICLMNFIVKRIQSIYDIKKFGLLENIDSMMQLLRYSESQEYQSEVALVREFEAQLRADAEFAVRWSKAPQQKIVGVINAGKSFLSSVSSCLSDSKKDLLSICKFSCQIIQHLKVLSSKDSEITEQMHPLPFQLTQKHTKFTISQQIQKTCCE